MFRTQAGAGWVEVIAGCMYSGKTEELIRRCRVEAVYGKRSVRVFKPAIDDRYAGSKVVTHMGTELEAEGVVNAQDILALCEGIQIVGIDEAQFFGPELVGVVDQLARGGKRVIVAGLDLDYTGKSFGPMPDLLALAEFVTKVQAICVVCGNSAARSQRLTQDDALVVVGAEGVYEARCQSHWTPPEVT